MPSCGEYVRKGRKTKLGLVHSSSTQAELAEEEALPAAIVVNGLLPETLKI